MVTKKALRGRIKNWIRVITFAIFMYMAFTFISPLVNTYFEPTKKPEKEVKIQQLEPLPGHWLKTKEDKITVKEKAPLPEKPKIEEEIKKEQYTKPKEVESLKPSTQPTEKEVEISHNNRSLSNTETVYYWTEGSKLKAVTIMSLNEKTKKGGIVALPLYTKIEYEGRTTTLADVFISKGRNAVTEVLEKQLEIKIESYVDIDQNTFEKLSDMMGPVDISGDVITVAEVFEQTRTGQRRDDTTVVRAVAKRIIQPDMLVKIPKMVWILSREIETNLGPSDIMTVYKMTKNTDVDTMTKVALPGKNYVENGKRFRDVPEQVWKNILWELTR